jgi:methionyl-tRNA synthetase
VSSISIEEFRKISLVIGQVEQAEPIENSKKLIRLLVNLGSFGRRQILAGLASFYDKEELIGKKVIVVENLKPAVIFGYESQGMLLAATSAGAVYLLEPHPNCEPGDVVS